MSKNPFAAYWSANQIAAAYGVSAKTVHQWDKKNWLPKPTPTPWGKMYLITAVKTALVKRGRNPI